jgi:hypothetical protein
MANRYLTAIGKAGFEPCLLLSIDDDDFMAVAGQIPRTGGADETGT